MNRLISSKLATTLMVLAGAFAGTLCNDALGQWKWTDEKGRVVYSDQPPPSGVAATKINAITGAAVAQQPAGDLPRESNKTAADRDLEARRAKANAEAAARQRETEDRREADRARRCASLRSELGILQQGGRIITPGPNGERQYLDEAGIASRSQEVRQSIDESCR